MKTKRTIINIGNSVGMTFSPDLVKYFKLEPGQEIEIEDKTDCMILRKVRNDSNPTTTKTV